MTFKQDYDRGMDALYMFAPHWYKLAVALGVPVESKSLPTAAVSFDKKSQRILFVINPDYIKDLDDEQIAFVIAHEAHHVVLDHFKDFEDKYFKDANALTTSQEAIINDSILNRIGLEKLEGIIYGESLGADFSIFTTKEGYDFLKKDDPDSEESDDQGEGADDSGSDSNKSSNSDGANGSSSGEPDKPSEGGSKSSDEDSDKNGSDSESSDEDSKNNADSESGESDEGSDSEDDGSDDSESGKSDDDSESGKSEGDSDDDDSDGENDSANGNSNGNTCGGFIVDPDDFEDFKNAVIDAFSDVLNKNADSMPDEMFDMYDSMDQDSTGNSVVGGFGNNTGSVNAGDPTDNLAMNWVKVLAEINPKILSSNAVKHKDSWKAPRRKMIAQYPHVILPTSVRADRSDDDAGNDKPTIVLALDYSYSIPRHLINNMISLADNLPRDLFNPVVVTWSDNTVLYDEDKRVAPNGGTNLISVQRFVNDLDKKMKNKVYVLVVTDGGYNAPLRDNLNNVQKHWYYASVPGARMKYLTQWSFVDPEHCFTLNSLMS